MKVANRCLSMTLVLLGLAACGGGSGGGDGAVVVPPPVAVLSAVTSENAETLAGAATSAALVSGDLGSLGGGSADAGPQPGMQTKTTGKNHWDLLVGKLVGHYFAAPIGPFTDPCLVSGFVTLSGDISNPATLSPGDLITSVFNACDDGDGVVMDGQLDMRIDSLEGSLDTGLFRLVMTLTLTGLVMDDGVNPVTSNGALKLELETRNFPEMADVVSGTRLRLSTPISELLQEDFRTATTVDASTLGYSIIATGKVSADSFDGYVTYATQDPLTGVGSGFPFAGGLLITGANGASILITALDSTRVLLEIDFNGDAAVDETREITWIQLIG